MSENRFILAEDSNGWLCIFDNEDSEDEPLIYGARFGTTKIVDLLNEQQATIDCLRQKKIKERKFVLDEKGIVEKISNKSYPRINSDEKDNPVATLSCGNLLDLVNLLNEQQATISRLEEENDNMNLFIKQTIEPLLLECVFELNTIETMSQVELAEKIEDEIVPFIQDFKYLKYESLEEEKQDNI